MIFSSLQFLLFFPVVFGLFLALRNPRAKSWMLLLASYVFYGSWDARFLTLILLSTVVDYVVGMRLPGASTLARRRAWLALSLVVNLGLLAFFKYLDFAAHALGDVAGWFGVELLPGRWLADTLGLPYRPAVDSLDILLPVGISFYTFQTLSYSIDVYKGLLRPTRDFVRFALFVAFFPQLVAGPIVRAVEFLPQLAGRMTTSWADVSVGIARFTRGMAKKVLIADNLAIAYVDPVFANAAAYDGATMWTASIGFAVQLYCDFSGYSDMAIGVARMLGFRLPENFRFPFAATNTAELWRRWHITLYSFIRDYFYIMVLGGSRAGRGRVTLNVLVSMTVSGLWHGAAWQFILWGFLNGVLVIASRWAARFLAQAPRLGALVATRLGTALCVTVTGLLFAFTMCFFRSDDLASALTSVARMTGFDAAGASRPAPWVLAVFVLTLLVNRAAEHRLWERLAARLAWPVVATGCAVLIAGLVLFGSYDAQAFVYFQF